MKRTLHRGKERRAQIQKITPFTCGSSEMVEAAEASTPKTTPRNDTWDHLVVRLLREELRTSKEATLVL